MTALPISAAALGTLLTGAAALAAPAAAGAAFGTGDGQLGALVVSASLERLEQADDASSVAAVSRNGRFVVFETRASNLFAADDPDPVLEVEGVPVRTDRRGGIFRRDLATGATVKVADGDVVAEEDGRLLVAGARNPSISADGRYVAFSTAQSLVAADSAEPRHRDVYVRDMERTTDAYELVSARDGGDVPLTYALPSTAVPGGAPGTDVWPGTSISADGRRVVLRTGELASDAPGDPDAAAGDPVTPAEQLLVRDLAERRTRLLTRRSADGRAAGGTSGPATISGDGSAIVWAGRNAQQQTRFLDGEPSATRAHYLLWRRADGSGTTRRVTGFADPEDPGCPPGSTIVRDSSSAGPCYGGLTDQEEVGGNISATSIGLSDDGQTVAYLTPQSRRGAPIGLPGADVFVTSMTAPRKHTTTEITREGLGDDAASRPIDSIAMSGDGRWLVLSTARVRFLAPPLSRIGPLFRAQALYREVYIVDRAAGTIERVTRSSGGGDPNGDAEPSVSVADGGERVAFVSAATNLFFGDTNQRPDAFVATRQSDPVPAASPPFEPPLPPESFETAFEPDIPELRVRALKTLRTGEVRLEVGAPGRGTLAATTRGRLPGRDGRRRASAPITTLARASSRPGRAGPVRLSLKLSKANVRLLRRARTLGAAARVTWTPSAGGQPPRAGSLRVTFRVIAARKKTTRKTTSAGTKRRRRATA